MITEFESRLLAAASSARSAGYIQTYLALMEVVRIGRDYKGELASAEHTFARDSSE